MKTTQAGVTWWQPIAHDGRVEVKTYSTAEDAAGELFIQWQKRKAKRRRPRGGG